MPTDPRLAALASAISPQGRGAPPQFYARIEQRDMEAIALEVVRELDNLAPLELPPRWSCSRELQKLLEQPQTVPDELAQEHEAYVLARDGRVHASAENLRRLRTTLWAEQCLRSHGRPEHELVRAFNREQWFVRESASRDLAEREQQALEHSTIHPQPTHPERHERW